MKTGRTPCRIKMVGNLETDFARIIVKQMTEYVTLEIQSTGEAIENQVENYFGAPLHSSFCVNIVFLTTNSKQAFLEAVTKESRNCRLEMLHFLFLKSQLFLQQIWQKKPVKRLKFKTVSNIYNVSRVLGISATKLGKSRNGSWEGLMGDMVTGKKDLLAGIGGISSRFEALDFSCTVAFNSLKRSQDIEPNDTIYLAIVIPFAALIESSPSIPNRARILTVITLFYALLVGQFYSSNLMSLLTFPEPEVVPQTFQDVSIWKDYTIYTTYLAGGSIEIFFNETDIETNGFVLWKEFDAPFSVQPVANHVTCLEFPNNIRAQEESKHFESVNSIVGWASDTGHFTKWRQLTMDNLKYTGSQPLKQRRNGYLYQGLEKLAQEFHHLATKPFNIENFVFCFTSAIVGSFLTSLAWVCEIVSSYDKFAKR
ncbi:unnamed protein product, partial [Allacma fusca]